jgi:Undecaprenyl-phosphate glucose phosphotransferase
MRRRIREGQPFMKHVMPAETLAQARRRPRLSASVLSGCARALETSALAALGLALRQSLPGAPADPADLFGPVAVALAAAALFKAAGAYRLQGLRAFPATLARMAAIWCGALAAFAAMVALLRAEQDYSRAFLWQWLAAGLVFLALERAALGLWTRRLARLGRFDRHAVIVGGGPMAELLLDSLARQPADLRILGLFDDRCDGRSPDRIAGCPKLGAVDDLVGFARTVRLDEVIFALPSSAEGRILSMLRKFWVLPVDVRLAAHANRLRFRPRTYSFIGSAPMFDLLDRPLSDSALFFKSAFDRVAGALLLLAFAPLMAAIALAVRLTSRGPALFRQQRLGFNNERIVVFKFRTLYQDQCDPLARRQVTRDDPRVTPLGRWLRRSSLDELPQLFNVLKGDLSLVGPRPHAADARVAGRDYDVAVDGYFARHRVKPGVTGWAQINGWRGETDTVEKIRGRVECDLDYIENWSMALDLYILALTPFALIFGENAY